MAASLDLLDRSWLLCQDPEEELTLQLWLVGARDDDVLAGLQFESQRRLPPV